MRRWFRRIAMQTRGTILNRDGKKLRVAGLNWRPIAVCLTLPSTVQFRLDYFISRSAPILRKASTKNDNARFTAGS